VAVAGLAGSSLTLAVGANAGESPAFSINRVSDYGGEPSLIGSPDGTLYEASLESPRAYRSADGGVTWTKGALATDAGTGDDCLASDQSNAIYMCNLTILGPDNAILQGDVYKSTDNGAHWRHGSGVVQDPRSASGDGDAICGTSCSPAAVDRDWVDAYIPPSANGDTDKAVVVLMYHDFATPSHIYVNVSTNGGETFGPPIDVLAHPAANPTAVENSAVGLADMACSTVPSNVQIAKSGPHAGRIYVAWIASDPTAFATGCNASQAQAFHNVFVAWSDDNGQTWTPQLAYDAGLFHDTSTPFVGFTLDNAGNPYFGFAANNTGYTPQVCAAPANPQTADCEYDLYVVWSPDGGVTWNGGGGMFAGTAKTALKVSNDLGTHWFPSIAAAGPGQVAVAYLHTTDVIPTDPNGKQHPGGCLPADPSKGCRSNDLWDLYAAQADLTKSTTFTVTKITQTPMHQGDICNLGIACPPGVSAGGVRTPNGNRDLADFISTAITPDGCQHVAYADDKTTHEVDSANQTAGCFSAAPSPDVPEASWAPLLAAIGIVAMVGVAGVRRRRRSTLAV